LSAVVRSEEGKGGDGEVVEEEEEEAGDGSATHVMYFR
jgi:hypothetical protein